MCEWYSLEAFVEENGFELSNKGAICVWLDGEKISLLKRSLEVMNIMYDCKDGNFVCLEVLYKFYGSKNREKESIEVKYLEERKIICDWKELYKKIEKYIVTEYRDYVLNLIKEYFLFCIKKFIVQHPELFTECGWLKYNGENVFLGINHLNEREKSSFKEDFFNGFMTSLDYKESFEYQCKKYNNFQDLFNFILENECAMQTFVYSIHAVMWYGVNGYFLNSIVEYGGIEDSIFSLCIYGKDIKRAKILANMLANVFHISQEHWTVIPRRYHISASSVTDSDLKKIAKYRCVPIIVTAKTNKIIKSSSIIKKFQRQRKNGLLFIFPVFISETPILIDGMVNCSSDDLATVFDIENTEYFISVHRQFCFVILELVKYFTKISNPDIFVNREPYRMFTNTHSILEELNVTDEWIQTHIPEILLYGTAKSFSSFLEGNPLKIWGERFKKKAKNVFISTDSPQIFSSKISKNIPSKNEKQYLQELILFINKEIKSRQNTDWIFEGTESRGEKEQCYYLNAKIGLKNFQEYLRRKHIDVIKERKFVQLLKESKVIKLPNSGNSNTFKRKNSYVFVIKKDSLETNAIRN